MVFTDYFVIGIFIGLIGILETRQTIYALLWLMFTFICSAIFFTSIGMSFLGLILVIVYIGAIAMLFLYMVMLLDPSYRPGSELSLYEFGAILVNILMFFLIPQHQAFLMDMAINEDRWIEKAFLKSDIGTMAASLYGQYGWPVILVGFLLLAAMLIAIDVARFQYDKKRGDEDSWGEYRLWKEWKSRRS